MIDVMTRVIFSSVQQSIVVSRQADGSYSWSGKYNGVAIQSAVPIDGGKCCVLLLDPDASPDPAFKNLLCIDQQGKSIWTATLPTSPDVFVRIEPVAEGIWANTWSGFKVLIDERTGVEIKRAFVK
jgi:hypothetical protein